MHKLLLIALIAFQPVFAKAQDIDDIPDVPAMAFTTLPEHLAAVSLIWELAAPSKADVNLIEAVGVAKLYSGKGDHSVKELSDFNAVNNVEFDVRATGKHVIVTIQTPTDRFLETMLYYNVIWRENDLSADWLKRFERGRERRKQARFRRPERVANILADYVKFDETPVSYTADHIMSVLSSAPELMIMNTKDDSLLGAEGLLLMGMKPSEPEETIQPVAPQELPKGLIYVHDPEATETLILFGEGRAHPDSTDVAHIDTLYKYMGYGPGSEMFRIVRQEERASYDPTDQFIRLNKDWFFTGLSATVAADQWPRMFDIMASIYKDARNGQSTMQGVIDSKDNMLGSIMYDLQSNPTWLAERYLELYGLEAPEGSVTIPEFDARFNLAPRDVNARAQDVMSPFEDLLVIVMGGSIEPPKAMRANGYCTLGIDEWLEVCLDKLSEN